MEKIITKEDIRETSQYKALEVENESLKSEINSLKNKVNNFIDSREAIKTELNNLEVQVKDLIKERKLTNYLKKKSENENKSLKRYIEKNIKLPKDYDDLTIIIPYRRTDDKDREENLCINLKYLSKIGISNLIISEHSNVSAQEILMEEYGHLFKSFIVIWNNSKGDLFNLAYAVNKGVVETKTPYFAMFDSDCLTKKINIDLAIALLNTGFDVVHPFNRRVTDIVEKKQFQEHYDFKTIKSPEQFRPWADGGIVFWNKCSFINIGMKNEYFSGWGGEDNETTIRTNLFQIFQYRIEDTLYHIYHHRVLVKNENNVEQIEKTSQIKNREMCIEEINKWPWLIDAKNKYFMTIK